MQWLVLVVALRWSQTPVIGSCFLQQASVRSLWTAELNDKLLLHTFSYAHLHNRDLPKQGRCTQHTLLCKSLKYHLPQTSSKNHEFFFKAFSVLGVCLQSHNCLFLCYLKKTQHHTIYADITVSANI